MLNRGRYFSANLYHFHFYHPFVRRCIGTKSGHGYGDVRRKNLAGKHGNGGEEEEVQIRLLKSRGQHLLTNTRVLDSIVRVSNINSDDTVLEIGPGTGNLTLKLLEAAKNVVAVEIDSSMVEILNARAAVGRFRDRLNIISGDALKMEFPVFDLVVANIPYGISSPLLAKLVYGANTNPFRSATLLLQKEFAKRLLAKPGDSEFNRLAVNINLLAEVEFVMDVSKRDFVPCPKVDSFVVKIYPKTEIPNVDLQEWWAFTRTCFNKKNKTLGATFKHKRKLMELMKFSQDSGFSEDSNSKRPEYDTNGDGDEECAHDDSILGSGSGVSLFRSKIVSILENGGFSDKRPSKLYQDDLLRLLSLFNEARIFFHHQASTKGICDADFVDDIL